MTTENVPTVRPATPPLAGGARDGALALIVVYGLQAVAAHNGWDAQTTSAITGVALGVATSLRKWFYNVLASRGN